MLNDKLTELVRGYNLAVEALTEKQFVEALRQAIASGDFVRMVQVDSYSQAVTYIPYREAEKYKRLYTELINCVHAEDKHEKALEILKSANEN